MVKMLESIDDGYVIKVKNNKDGYNYEGCGGRSLVRIDSSSLSVFPSYEDAKEATKGYKNRSRIKIIKLSDARKEVVESVNTTQETDIAMEVIELFERELKEAGVDFNIIDLVSNHARDLYSELSTKANAKVEDVTKSHSVDGLVATLKDNGIHVIKVNDRMKHIEVPRSELEKASEIAREYEKKCNLDEFTYTVACRA